LIRDSAIHLADAPRGHRRGGAAPARGERYGFDATPVHAVAYEELDHVRLTRDFLNAPERYLNQILEKRSPPF
jgi:hypothetical protein